MLKSVLTEQSYDWWWHFFTSYYTPRPFVEHFSGHNFVSPTVFSFVPQTQVSLSVYQLRYILL